MNNTPKVDPLEEQNVMLQKLMQEKSPFWALRLRDVNMPDVSKNPGFQQLQSNGQQKPFRPYTYTTENANFRHFITLINHNTPSIESTENSQ